LKSLGAPESRILVMPQVGLDPEKLCPVDDDRRCELRRQAGLPVDAFLIGAAGRLVPEKGYPELLGALDSLRATGRDVHLAVMGSGPLESQLRGHAGVTLLPARPRHEIAPFYQALDVFVLASRTTRAWKEQFGMVAAEAMSCGVPVVGTDSGAIPEVVGEGGITVPEGAPDALAEALQRLREAPALRKRLSRTAREQSSRGYAHRTLADAALAAILQAKATPYVAPA
jgi:glycosyltransferase involved in cell wall biosynthesis